MLVIFFRSIMSKSVYDIIKRQNGESFAKAVRKFDSGIFDIENFPQVVRYAGRNALPLLLFLEGLKTKKGRVTKTNKTPFQLLSEAGYNALYADTLEKQNSIKHYFAKNEALCTFHDDKRYQEYHIIHAVRRGAEKLKRADFNGIEKREDEYGTSVISIQILKEGGFISIKNRYNHSVENPDNTFDSNPDNIINGLSYSLRRYFGVDFKSNGAHLGDDYTFQNGCIYKFIDEIDNVYYGQDFYLKNGVVYPVNKDYQLMANEFLIDFKEKTILDISNRNMQLYQVLKKELQGENLSVRKIDGKTCVFSNDKEILAIKEGRIERLSLYKTKKVHNFLQGDYDLQEFYGYSLVEISGRSFSNCGSLKKVVLPRCEKMSQDSFRHTFCAIEAKKLEKIGFYFLGNGVAFAPCLKKFYLRGRLDLNLYNFLNKEMQNYKYFDVQKEETGHLVLADGKPFLRFKDNKLTGIYLHKGCKRLDERLINHLGDLEEFVSLETEIVLEKNFYDCPNLEKISLPKAKTIMSEDTFYYLESLQEVDLSSYQENKYGYSISFYQCPNIKKIKTPLLQVYGKEGFFYVGGIHLWDAKNLEQMEVKNGLVVVNKSKLVGKRMVYDNLKFVNTQRGARE